LFPTGTPQTGGSLLTEKELRKLNRYQLLELLIIQTARADKLQKKLEDAEAEINDKSIRLTALGSIAEASLQLGGVFEAAQKAADIYHKWQAEGTDGENYEVPELYRSVGIKEIEENGWSLVPSKYIEFIDHDLDIDFNAEMSRIQREMQEVLKQEKQSQKMLENAFRGIGYGID